MVVLYPTRDQNLGLLFLQIGDIDLNEFEGDPAVDELISTMPEPKFIPIPKAPPIWADQRFELLHRQQQRL